MVEKHYDRFINVFTFFFCSQGKSLNLKCKMWNFAEREVRNADFPA